MNTPKNYSHSIDFIMSDKANMIPPAIDITNAAKNVSFGLIRANNTAATAYPNISAIPARAKLT